MFSLFDHPIRLLGDIMHLASFIILFLKIESKRSSAGVSLKTQEIYAVVFLTRYADLFTNDISYYLTVMKIIFILSTLYIIYLIRYKYNKSYSKGADVFPNHWLTIVLPCAVLAPIVSSSWTVLEVRLQPLGYTALFSMFDSFYKFFSDMLTGTACLDSVEVRFVSFYMTFRSFFSACTNFEYQQLLTAHYIASLGAYRALYLLNWIVRLVSEAHFSGQWVSWVFGLVQTIFYCDFFYEYLKSMWYKQAMTLPSKAS